MNKKTVCFTGHRKIRMNENELQEKLINLIFKTIENGYTHFICGGAMGFDMLVAERIIYMKTKLFNNITLEIAVPFLEQDKLYSTQDKSRYAFTLKHANKTTVVCNSYNKYCYMLRNKYMVDNSSLIIAYFDGSACGTKNTIEYAKTKQKEIWFI